MYHYQRNTQWTFLCGVYRSDDIVQHRHMRVLSGDFSSYYKAYLQFRK